MPLTRLPWATPPYLQGSAKSCRGQTPQEDMCLLQSGNQMRALGALRKSEPGCCYQSACFGLQVPEKSDNRTLAQPSAIQTSLGMQVTGDLFEMQGLIQ